MLAGVAAALALLLRPGPDRPEIARVELAQGRDQLVLQRRLDTGQWVIASADDAPGDAARIETLIDTALAVEFDGPAAALPAAEPLELRLTARDDRVLRHLALWPGVARELPDGAPFASRLALPKLAPSAWSSLRPPVIDPAAILAARLVRPEGATDLAPAEVATLAASLARLSADGWVPARALDWTVADYVQATRADGAIIEIQRLALPDGRRFVRLTSDRDPALRASRFFAFALEAPVAAGPEPAR